MKRILFLIVLGISVLQFANAQPYSIMVVGESVIDMPTVTIDVGSLTDVEKVEVVAIAEMTTVPVDVEFSSDVTKTASFSSIISSGDATNENFSPFSQAVLDGPYDINGTDYYLGYYTATFDVSEIDAVTHEIELDKMGQGNGILTFYAYVYRTGSPEVYSTLADAEKICYIYHNNSTNPAIYEFTLDSDNPMDIEVLIPFSDNLDIDDRIGFVELYKDDVLQGTPNQFSLNDGATNFNVVMHSLNDVDPEVTKIVLKIYSPNPSDPVGDSFFSGVPVMKVTEKPDEDPGCTLTWGYWKTHADPSKKKYDSTWENVGGQEADFFDCGQTYKEVMKTPSANNAYYILAHQFIAVELNEFAGADMSDVQAAFDAAKELLETYCPEDIEGLEGDDPLRKQFVDWGEILDDFNMGEIGPGHCDDLEDLKSAEIAKVKNVDFTVYPNPVRGNAMLSFNPIQDGYATIDIYNSTGRKKGTLFSQRVKKDIPVNYTFDSNEFTEGLYIVRYQNGTSSRSIKIQIGR